MHMHLAMLFLKFCSFMRMKNSKYQQVNPFVIGNCYIVKAQIPAHVIYSLLNNFLANEFKSKGSLHSIQEHKMKQSIVIIECHMKHCSLCWLPNEPHSIM